MLLKVLSLNAFSVGANFVFGIVSTKIISVYLGAQGMALLGNLRNFAAMGKAAATVGLNNAAVRLLVEHKEDASARSKIAATFFWTFLTLCTVLSAIGLALAPCISQWLFFDPGYAQAIRFFALQLPLIAMATFCVALYNAHARYSRIVLGQIFSAFFIFVLTVFLVFKQHITGGIWAVVLSEVVVFLTTLGFVLKDRLLSGIRLLRRMEVRYLREIGKFSGMALLSAVVIPLTMIGIRNLITNLYGLEQAGIWEAVNKLSGFYMSLVGPALSLYYMPRLASLRSDADFKLELRLYFTLFIPLCLVMLALVYLTRYWILDLAFTKDFSGVAPLLGWQLLGDALKIMTLAFGYQVLVKAMLWRYVLIELAHNGVYFLLACLWLPQLGISGAVKAYAVASFVSLVIVVVMFRRVIFLNLNPQSPAQP